MTNAAPQLFPLPDYDLGFRDTIADASASPVKEQNLPTQLDLYLSRIAPQIAKETGETIEQVRDELNRIFAMPAAKPVSSEEMLRNMDWDDAGEVPETGYRAVSTSGIVSKPAKGESQLLSDEEGIPVYVDKKEVEAKNHAR